MLPTKTASRELLCTLTEPMRFTLNKFVLSQEDFFLLHPYDSPKCMTLDNVCKPQVSEFPSGVLLDFLRKKSSQTCITSWKRFTIPDKILNFLVNFNEIKTSCGKHTLLTISWKAESKNNFMRFFSFAVYSISTIFFPCKISLSTVNLWISFRQGLFFLLQQDRIKYDICL